ncbi:MAG: alanine--glyoxylate aminotransferase family protein [Gemmatimonadota bacterium]|nr:alanine--glyoxylate aminotransferase family protein [Gemmatimonadota bacterium]
MKTYNFVPGPTPVPTEVTARMSQPILTHRSAEFSNLLHDVTDGLRYIFQTQNDVLTLTASGSGAMESVIVNLLSPGDRAVAIVAGKFGGRWVELCGVYGIELDIINVPWGDAVNPDTVYEVLSKRNDYKALLATHSETSTGVLHDIQSLGRIARSHDVLFVVDAISGLGANDLKTDGWEVDVVVTGSQKALMLPPGLSFVSLSERAWEATTRSTSPKYYLSFERAQRALEKGLTPYTPAVSLLMGLSEILNRIRAMGLDSVFSRHGLMAGAMRLGVQEINLELFATSPSNVLTSVKIPEGIDGPELLKHIKTAYGVTFADGMGDYEGITFRIAHLGYAVDSFDIVIAISALERGLACFGHDFDLGAGVAAVQKFFHQAEAIQTLSAG